jgi:hypothetical protein
MGIITRGAMRPKRPKIDWGQGADAAYEVDGVDTEGWWSDPEEFSPDNGSGSSVSYLGDTYHGIFVDAFSLFSSNMGLQQWTAPVVSGLTPNAAVTAHFVVRWWTTTGYDPAGAAPFIQLTGGSATSLAGIPWTNGGSGAATAFAVTGTVNAAGQLQMSFGWTFGPGSQNAGMTVCLMDLTTTAPGPGGGLLFAEPLDRALAFAKRAPGSMQAKGADAASLALWHLGTDDVLTGLARWIPLDTGTDRYGTTSTGWHGTDGTDGWRSFLEHARERKRFTFYPDRDNDAVSYECIWEGEVSRPEPEGNRAYQQPFAIRSLSGPFEGY